MKILHLMNNLSSGGTENMLVQLLPHLKEEGFESEVEVLSAPYDLGLEIERYKIPVHRFDLGHRWNFYSGIKSLTRLHHNNSYDIIHARLFYPTVVLGLAGLSNVKKVVSFHSLEYGMYPISTPLKKTRKMLHAYLVNHRFDGILANGEKVAEHYKKHLKISHVDVIRNGI